MIRSLESYLKGEVCPKLLLLLLGEGDIAFLGENYVALIPQV